MDKYANNVLFLIFGTKKQINVKNVEKEHIMIKNHQNVKIVNSYWPSKIN
jgi:hypothetical protein